MPDEAQQLVSDFGLTPKLIWRFALKEVAIRFLNGTIFAALSAIIVIIWFADIYIAAIIAVAMIINLTVAALSGVLIPHGLHKMGIDPAISSTVFFNNPHRNCWFLCLFRACSLVLILAQTHLYYCKNDS